MVDAADLTTNNVRGLRNLKEQDVAHIDVDPPKMNSKNWPLTIEAMEEWLRGCLCVTKIPLAYVIRWEETIPAVDPVGGYATPQDELIARAPI
jgi:hypothetical protein